MANQMTITHWDSGMSLLGYQGLVYWPTPLEFGVAARCRGLGDFLLLLGPEVPPRTLRRRPPNRLLRYKISLFEEPQARSLRLFLLKERKRKGTR